MIHLSFEECTLFGQHLPEIKFVAVVVLVSAIYIMTVTFDSTINDNAKGYLPKTNEA